jgi:hypothetical protein
MVLLSFVAGYKPYLPVQTNKANILDRHWQLAVYQNPMKIPRISVQAVMSAERFEMSISNNFSIKKFNLHIQYDR